MEVAKAGLSERTTFVGHVDGERKAEEFFGADVCVVPSFSESFGMVVAEALSHGIPVIASRGTPWPELESRKCGLWVENSPHAIKSALEEIAARDLEAMGTEGRKWMVEKFGWNAVASQMASLYLEMRRAKSGD
jgi:glycosyltransferase involved in cell wall biosynthesis